MLLSLAPISLASQSQSWTEDRRTGGGRGGWKGKGTGSLPWFFFHSSAPDWIFFSSLCLLSTWCCSVEGKEEKPSSQAPRLRYFVSFIWRRNTVAWCDLMVGGWDGETGGEDGCASGGRHQEQSEGVEATSLAVMEDDVLWSNGSCVCVCVCLS